MDPKLSNASVGESPGAARLGRLLASPASVLVILPLLVISAGVTVLMLGRRATNDASDSMARRALTAQAASVQHDVAFALDQATPLLASLAAIADPNVPLDDMAIRMRDLVIGRPGVANISVSYPNGNMRGTFVDTPTGELQVQQSIVGDRGTERVNIGFAHGPPQIVSREITTYDPRTRPHYLVATQAKTRVWMPPRTFFTSHRTGLTVTEPLYAADGSLRAVTTVDFDVRELSSFIERPPFEAAKTVVFAADGTILAFPAAKLPEVAIKENRLLRHEDYADPALEALFATIGTTGSDAQRFLQIKTSDGDYLASIAPVGGKRAGITAPLDWYLATLVPERVLLGPTHRLETQSLFASGGALAIALGVALMFAWNLVRMRRAVGVARERARSAEARAKELGSYRLVAKLGAGGMGEVWRAEHRLLARQAAVKLVRPEVLTDAQHAPKIRERFRREAQTLASMTSRHTIALFDYGVTDDGTFFYVMELLDGLDLDKLVRQHGAQPAARVIHLMIQACQSLAEAHDAGLLHRDIKPANLVTCRAADEVDVLKLLDFGIVHTIADGDIDPLVAIKLPPVAAQRDPSAPPGPTPSGRLTQAGSLVGTPGYIPPEQAFGMRIDARADLYALACVAWWLLTASEVYPRNDEDEAIRAHVHEPVPSLRARMHGWVPNELCTLITACLGKTPEERPADARAMIRALRAIPIPDEQAWSETRALNWWGQHRPLVTGAPRGTAPASDPAAERLLVPNLDESHVPATGPDVVTIAARRSERVIR